MLVCFTGTRLVLGGLFFLLTPPPDFWWSLWIAIWYPSLPQPPFLWWLSSSNDVWWWHDQLELKFHEISDEASVKEKMFPLPQNFKRRGSLCCCPGLAAKLSCWSSLPLHPQVLISCPTLFLIAVVTNDCAPNDSEKSKLTQGKPDGTKDLPWMAGGSNADYSGSLPLCLCEFSRHLPKKPYENELLDLS